MTQGLHIKFGAVASRDYEATPATAERAARAARTVRYQKGLIVWPPSDDLADLGSQIPFEVALNADQPPYDPRQLYQLTGHHLRMGQFGRIEFNAYAPFSPLAGAAPGQAGERKLSEQAKVA